MTDEELPTNWIQPGEKPNAGVWRGRMLDYAPSGEPSVTTISMSDQFRKTLTQLYKIGVDRQHARAAYLIDKLVADMHVLETAAAENVVKLVVNAQHSAGKEIKELTEENMRLTAALYVIATDTKTAREMVAIAASALGMGEV